MPLSRFLLACALLAPGAAPLAGASIFVNDLRVTLGTGVSPDSADENYTGNGVAGADPDGIYHYDSLDHSGAGEVTVGYYGGRIWRYGGGFVWGAGLEVIGATYRAPLGNSKDVNLTDVGPFLQVGWGYAFDRYTHLEITGFIAGGSCRGGWVDDATPDTVVNESGSFIQGGLRVGVYWTIEHTLVLGVQGELSSMDSYLSVDNPNGSHSDVDVYSDGGAIQGVIGVHF